MKIFISKDNTPAQTINTQRKAIKSVSASRKFISFKDFTQKLYETYSDKMKKIYGNADKHRAAYLSNKGFADWLETFRGEKLSMSQMESVAETYYTYGKRSVSDVLSSLVYLARQYDVEYPAEEGILTKAYWEKHFSSSAKK